MPTCCSAFRVLRLWRIKTSVCGLVLPTISFKVITTQILRTLSQDEDDIRSRLNKDCRTCSCDTPACCFFPGHRPTRSQPRRSVPGQCRGTSPAQLTQKRASCEQYRFVLFVVCTCATRLPPSPPFNTLGHPKSNMKRNAETEL